MLTSLDTLIKKAIESNGTQEDVNKVYLTLLHTELFIPTKKKGEYTPSDDEPFQPLYAQIEGHYFIAAFDTVDRLKTWANEKIDEIEYVTLSGRDVIAGIGENVFLALNVATPYYKEFSPDEIKRLKMIVSRIDQLSKSP